MGMIFDIQRACTDDGPGIRTTVFFKGCPLRCLWCHNPESHAAHPQQYADTGETIGYEASATQIMEMVLRDLPYYQATGGGITLSGGEPLMQPALAQALLSTAKEKGIHTCVETCGHAPWEAFTRILPLTDLFLYDVKALPHVHRSFTGVDSGLILSNLGRLCQSGAQVLLRCPLIPGYNDTAEHFAFLRSLLKKHPALTGLQIMPYHNFGVGKARRLQMPHVLELPNPAPEVIARWRSALGCNDDNFCPGESATKALQQEGAHHESLTPRPL